MPPTRGAVGPDGTVTLPDGTIVGPDGTVTLPDGTTINPFGETTLSNGTVIDPLGEVTVPDGSTIGPDRTIISNDGTVRFLDGATIGSGDVDADLFFLYGFNSYESGDLRAALFGYTHAIKLDPTLARAYHNRGIIYIDRGDALMDLNMAIQVDSGYVDAYYSRGLVNDGLGISSDAISDYEQFLRLRDAEDSFTVFASDRMEELAAILAPGDHIGRFIRCAPASGRPRVVGLA